MFNYYLDANIRINKIANYDMLIKNYKVNHEEKYIKINYMCGREEIVPYFREKVEFLDMLQQRQFEKMKKDIYPKLNRRTFGIGSAATISSAISIANLAIGNPLIALACLSSTTGGLMQTKCIKIKREMELISWINSHRKEINEVIKDEVHSLAPPESFDDASINPIIKDYPKDSIYPEEMYRYGINLSNIDNLGLNDLRTIKRKVKRRQRQLKKS